MDVLAAIRWFWFLFLFFLLPHAAAQTAVDWIPLDEGLEGDQVDLLWRSPAGTFFAGGRYSGLFRSPAYREPWEMTALHKVHVQEIAADSLGNVYAAGYEGLFVSTDEGQTWMNTNLTDPVYAVATMPNGSTFAGTYNGLYRLQPGEKDFALVKQWHIDQYVPGGHNEEIEPVSLMAVLNNGTLAIAVASNLYLSTDGNTWNCLSVDEDNTCWERRYQNGIGGISNAQITSLNSFDNTLLIGDYGGILTYCPATAYDAEQNKFVSSLPFLGNEFIDGTESNSAFFQVMELCNIQGSGGGIYLFRRSKETIEAPWETIHEEAYAVEVDQDDQWLCIGKNNGVHCSEDGGITWSPWNEGLNNAKVNAVFVSEDTLLFAGTMHGMYQDITSEEPWKPIILNQTSGNFTRTCISSPYAFTQTAEPRFFALGGGMYSTVDPADMWVHRGTSSPNPIFTDRPEPFDFPFCGTTFNYWVSATNPNVCRALPRSSFRQDGTFSYRIGGMNGDRSTDGFTTSERIRLPGRTGMFTLPGRPLYSYQDNELWQSQDHGDTWTKVPFPEVPVNLLDFALVGDSTLVAGTTAGIYVSQDIGQSWSNPIAEDQCFNLIEANGRGVIVAGDKLISSDHGISWQSVETPLPGYINSMTFDSNGFIYAGTDGWGVFKSAQPIHSVTSAQRLTTPFKASIFPNPVQNEFKVKVEFSQLAEIQIDLYDILGRHHGQLARRPLSRGVNFLRFTRAGLVSGVYMIRITAGGQVKYVKTVFR